MAQNTDEEVKTQEQAQTPEPAYPQIDPKKSTTANVNDLIRNNEDATSQTASDLESATSEYQDALNANAERQKQSADNYVSAQNANENQYKAMLASWLEEAKQEREEQRKKNEQQNKSDYRTRLFGGIADASAAIANLIGTVHGASPIKWQSQQEKWAKKADEYRKERDAKLQTLDAQLKALDRQKAQLEYAMGKDSAERAYKVEQADINNANAVAKVGYDGAVNSAKVKNVGKDKSLSLAMQGLNMGRYETNKGKDDAYRRYQQALHGYDPETGLFYNPSTGEYDSQIPLVSPSGKSTAKDTKNDGKSATTKEETPTEPKTETLEDIFK